MRAIHVTSCAQRVEKYPCSSDRANFDRIMVLNVLVEKAKFATMTHLNSRVTVLG